MLKKLVKSVSRLFSKYWKKATIVLVVALIGFTVARKTILKPPPQYETAEAKIGDIATTLEVSGEVDAEQKAILKFQTGGRLAWVGVKEGDRVNKWQAVASLDKSILKKTLKKYLSDYMHQRWDFDQIREDNQVSSDNYDEYSFTNTIERLIEQEQFLLDKTVTDVEIQDITNRWATIVSPIDGVVTDIDTPVAGVNVTITDAFDIVDPATLYFEAEIDESDIGSIHIGQKAEILLEAFDEEPISSSITWLDFAASTSDSGGTVFIAKIALAPNDTDVIKYRLGMTGDATITLQEKFGVLLVPLDALEENDDGSFVKILKDTEVVEQKVELGLETDDYVEIISGLNEGDQVITGEKEE